MRADVVQPSLESGIDEAANNDRAVGNWGKAAEYVSKSFGQTC